MPSYKQGRINHANNTGVGFGITGKENKSGKPGHNDDLDAFRHAYSWADLAKAYGPMIANMLGHLNELDSENEDETQMDLHNNAVGISVAQRTPQEDISKTVAHAVKAGVTINDPFNENLTDPNRPTVTSFLDATDLFNFENQIAAQQRAKANQKTVAA